MKLAQPRCSICGELAVATMETVDGEALLTVDDDGNAEYTGQTDIDWNSQRTKRDKFHNAYVVCPDGHEWVTQLIE